MQNMPQNGQKRQKVQKPKKCTNENWPIFIPCDVDDHFWWSKQAKNTQKQPYLVGLSENRWKNTKNAISQKGLAKRFWKLVKFMSYMCTLRIKSKQTSYRKVRLDVVWGKCEYWVACNCVIIQEELKKDWHTRNRICFCVQGLDCTILHGYNWRCKSNATNISELTLIP